MKISKLIFLNLFDMKELTEIEILCVQRNRAKGKTFKDIANRLSIGAKELKKYWKLKTKQT